MEEFWNLFVFICYVIRKKPEKPILMVFFIFMFICVNEIEIILWHTTDYINDLPT